jgi:hypothetical protein
MMVGRSRLGRTGKPGFGHNHHHCDRGAMPTQRIRNASNTNDSITSLVAKTSNDEAAVEGGEKCAATATAATATSFDAF